jgi:pimeloyl-ACP methyl ester carboxylesterase
MVDPTPLAVPVELRRAVEAIVAAIEAGNQVPRRQFIAGHLFLPIADRALVDRVLEVMMAAPAHVAGDAMKGVLAFDGVSVAQRCKVPALHLMATATFNPPHLMAEWLPGVVQGWTVGTGHFNMMEVPEQVNSMVEGFLQHHLAPGERAH